MLRIIKTVASIVGFGGEDMTIHQAELARPVEPQQEPRLALIVDDDPIMRDLSAFRLAPLGYSCRCVENGEEATGLLAKENYALAIVDLNMPKLDGFGLLKHIRQHPRTIDLPTIVATTNDDRQSIEKAYALGASSFVTKPINWSQFLHHIQFVVRSGETEHKLRQAQAAAEAASNLKNGLFLMLSNELKEPVTSLAGFANTLASALKHRVEAIEADHLFQMVDAAKHLNAIISDLLLYSRTLGGRDRLEPELTLPSDLLTEAAAIMKSRAREKNVLINCRSSFDEKPVRCDGKLIQRALLKLVDNAIRFSPEGGTVEIWAYEKDEDSMVISVRDNGPGMSERRLEEVLRKDLASAAPYTRQPGGGLGLGLMIARSVAEAHGGELICQTAPGQGMVAALYIPSQADEMPASRVA
jgi:signal transduction histidine kinase